MTSLYLTCSLKAVIGSSGELKDLFSKMAEKLKLVESGRLIPRVRGSDQELMTRVNLDSIRKEGHQAVLGDDHLMLFQVVTFSYKDLIFQSLGETIRDGRGLQRTLLQGIVEENADWEPRRIAFNHISETVPSLLHFPGPKKPEFWWDYMWWMQPITIVDFFGRPKENITPAQVFYKKMKSHTDEASGYGAKLPDDSWLSYMDLCEPFVEDILK